MRGGPKDDLGGEFSFAKKMLKGLKSPETEASPPREEGSSSGDEAGGDMLKKLVDALKKAPVKISAVEPDGWGHLLKVRDGGAPLGPGARGDAVEALQRALRKAGIDAPNSGRYDAPTEAAVQRLQRENGLPLDGVFGPAAFEALRKALNLEEPQAAPEAPVTPKSRAGVMVLPPTGNAFIDKLAPGAVRGMHASGVPASVLIAMSVLESNWGESLLAREHSNLFGLEGTGTAGSVMMREDDAGNLVPGGQGTPYRSYKSTADSVEDFAKLFAKAEAYQGIMSHRGHPESFAQALGGAFSANPNYGSVVVRIMRQFDLARFDRVPAPPRDED